MFLRPEELTLNPQAVNGLGFGGQGASASFTELPLLTTLGPAVRYVGT